MKIYDCKRGLLPPYPISKPVRNDVAYAANRMCVRPASAHPPSNSCTKPVENALQTLHQMIGTVQPMAQTQEYKSQQMLSVVKANPQAPNTTSAHQVVSQAASRPLPGKRQIPILAKNHAVSSTRVQQLAVNGLVWMTTTTTGQNVQSPNAHNIYSARVIPALNPGVAYQNAAQSSNLLISLSSPNGSVPQISMDQKHVNLSESEGNCNLTLDETANNLVKCHGQVQIQGAYGKVGTDLNKGPEGNVTYNASAQPGQRNWPALTNGGQVRAGSSNNTLQASERTGQSVCLSSQPSMQHSSSNSWFASTNSNSQKRMVLARVTPMSHDWKDLQQNPRSLQSPDPSNAKDVHVQGTQLHYKLSDQNGVFQVASSTSEKFVEKQNQATPSSPTEMMEQKSVPFVPAVPPLTSKPELCPRDDVHNIHFYFTPSTMNEVSIITSQVPSSVNAQQNLMSPGNLNANVSSHNTVPETSQFTPLSHGHCNFGESSVGSSNSIFQHTVTASTVEVGALCNSEQQSTIPLSDPPNSINVLCSAVNLASKSVGKQTIQLVSSGSNPSSEAFSTNTSLHSSVSLLPRENSEEQATSGLVLVIPPSVLVQNCQNMEASSVCSPSTVLTGEEHAPVRLTEYQGETSSLVVDVPTPESEKSKTAQPAATSLLNLNGQPHQEIISSSIAEGFGEQANCGNTSAEPSQVSAEMLVSSTELNGKKRNLILDAEVLPKDCGFHHDVLLCDGQENATDSPPQKRFMASAVEGSSKSENVCKNVPLPDKKKMTNSSELKTCSGNSEKNEVVVADETVASCNTDQPEICITGVFSLGDNTGMWKSVQQSSPCPVVDLTSSPPEETNDASTIKETGESSLQDQAAHGGCNIVKENPQVSCLLQSNLESEQCPSVKEFPPLGHAQSVLESSQEKRTRQQTPQSDTSQVNVLIDLTADKDHFPEPQQSPSVMPSDFKEQDGKLVCDHSTMSVEINSPTPLKFSDNEPQGLDDLLHSIDTEIETLLNFWNPYPPKFACANVAKSASKHHNLHKSENCESKVPNIAKETASSVFEEVQMPDESEKAGLSDNLDCNSSCSIKVLGHTEILNLLAEIAKPKLHEKLPPGSIWSETFNHSDARLSEETPSKVSQNACSDGWKAGSSKAVTMKLPVRQWGDQNPTLHPVTNKNSCAKKGKRERKEYCCINAWLAASGVLGIYCHCKLSQGNKTESQVDLQHAMPETQNSNETSNPNCIVKHMDIEATLHSVPVATHRGHALEVSESWNSGPRSCTDTAPDSNQAEVLRDVKQDVCIVQAMQQQARENSTRLENDEMEGLCKPGVANPSSLGMSEELDRLPCKVAFHKKSDLRESKDLPQDLVEIEPDKDTWTVLELNEDKKKNGNKDPSSNVLRKKIGHQTGKWHVNRHLGVKLGFKVMKRKPDTPNCRSPQKQRKSDTWGKERKYAKCPSLQKNHHPQKKTRYDVADAKLLPNYNCHVMIRDKTYSSSGERAVLVNLVPVSGKICKTKVKTRTKSK
ncbi:uncharacterized protein LOC109933807 [Rhincodon typus]|uniref:uncharacterized protein LOC109933807 n=1 Tax=Rhincodon typus TaxID=259920 RepID=UPI0020302D4F|nr:uncharacterized protein LOC109933807 [Rhincodon typus]